MKSPAFLYHFQSEFFGFFGACQVAQRVYGLALRYEDLKDHEQLRRDPLLADKSTLNRLELSGAVVEDEERYKKISLKMEAVERLLVELFLEAHPVPPEEIVFDMDATDDLLQGN